MKLDSSGGPESIVLEDTDSTYIQNPTLKVFVLIIAKPALELNLVARLGVQGFKDA